MRVPACALQMDLMSLVEGVVARQDEMAQQMAALSTVMAQQASSKGRHDLTAWLQLP